MYTCTYVFSRGKAVNCVHDRSALWRACFLSHSIGYLRIGFHFLIWTAVLLLIGEIDKQVTRSGGQKQT